MSNTSFFTYIHFLYPILIKPALFSIVLRIWKVCSPPSNFMYFSSITQLPFFSPLSFHELEIIWCFILFKNYFRRNSISMIKICGISYLFVKADSYLHLSSTLFCQMKQRLIVSQENTEASFTPRGSVSILKAFNIIREKRLIIFSILMDRLLNV